MFLFWSWLFWFVCVLAIGAQGGIKVALGYVFFTFGLILIVFCYSLLYYIWTDRKNMQEKEKERRYNRIFIKILFPRNKE